jgi:ABC-type multidrug transport system ATPase subunit
MIDPSDGVVLLDGIDIKSVSLVSLRDRVAVVPQDTSLFDNTVEYNIKYGVKTEPSADMLLQVLQNCSLDETIAKLSNGLQTQVGERGAVLSGGERQKVSIARALLKDPTLILCDEVTSAVDAFAERDIVELLKRATASRTTLTVAHRLSSIAHCDNIIVMDKGIVVEQGSHSELLNSGGSLYRRLWEAQNGISSPRTNRVDDNNVEQFVQQRYSQIQRILTSQLRNKRFERVKDSSSNALYAAVRVSAELTTTSVEPVRDVALLQGKDNFGSSQELNLMELRLLEDDRERERARLLNDEDTSMMFDNGDDDDNNIVDGSSR